MKYVLSLSVLAMVMAVAPAAADLVIDDPAYSANSYYADGNSVNSIVSFDWDVSQNLYYETATPAFNFGGFYEYNGTSTSTLAAANSDFSGASVVSIGDYVYYNTSDFSNQKIYQYGPTNGSPTLALSSTTANFGLYAHNGSLYITGSADFGTNHIYYSSLNASGGLVSNPAIDLGVTSGSSGPLAFDSAGNLYYAPGFGDLSIYKWSAAEVTAALLNPSGNPLSAAGHQWLDYSSLYGSVSGGTSLLVENGQLLLTLTDFSNPSDLVSFGIGGTGAYNGSATTILQSTGVLGELRQHNGNLYVSDGNQIYQLAAVPEPSSAILMGVGLLILGGFFRKRHRRTIKRGRHLAVVALGIVLSTLSVSAGPFSPASDQPGSTGISVNDPNIVGWATGVVSFQPGPVDITNPTGATANFGVPQNALGAADATASNPFSVVSLGDGGSITLSFSQPISNHPGTDLAVFENGFAETGVPNAYFNELAFVAVSSDGVNFFTFPSVSLTQTTTQVGGFGTLDPTNIYNLAGKDIAGYGTAFDLDDLAGISPLLNIDDITEVRITDVIGNINTSLGTGTYSYDDAANPIFNGLYGTTDHLINDPFKTNFSTGGFDLDAVAIVNEVPEPSAFALLLAGLVGLAGIHRMRGQEERRLSRVPLCRR